MCLRTGFNMKLNLQHAERPVPSYAFRSCFTGDRRVRSWGFSLIELIGVTAVIAILALALSPILIKQLDRIAGDKENAQLKAFAEAFRQGVLKTKTIPDQTGWAAMVAANSGMEIS